MKSAILLSTLAALLQGTAARTLPRNPTSLTSRADCETSDFISCIVSLAELPLQITTCIEAVNDINELFDDLDNNQKNLANDDLKLDLQGADCIAEAFLASVELPEHCSGCTKALDGECSNADVPCTGPPPAGGGLRRRSAA